MLLTSSALLDFLILLVTGLYALHLYISKNFKFWEKRGIYSPKTKPFVGNFLDVILLKTTTAEWMKYYYDKIDKDFFGVYVFNDPYFVVKNPELIKNILIKDFSHFVDRTVAEPAHSPVTSHILFFQNSPAWKYGRTKMSPVFTPAKLKAMFPLVLSCGDDLKKYLEENQTVLEAKEVAAMFTTDVISRCAFGINSYSFKTTDSTFTANRRSLLGFSYRNAFAQTVYFFKPSWVNKFKINFFEKNTLDYFTEVFKESMRARTEKNQTYSDLIDILNELKQTNELNIDGSDDAMFCGTAVQFFIAGFETTSATVSFTLHELALNLSIQQTIRDEIINVLQKHGGLTYEAIHDMTYLDMCITETLRKYPVVPFIERKCNQDYLIPDSKIIIEKDTPVLIPMLGLHMDEKYFPDPKKYDPERFRTRSHNTNGVYFLPFGEGPRNCLGERFGKISTRVALIKIISDFEVTPCSKTPVPIIFEPKSFLLQSNVGLPLQFTKLK